MTLSHVMRCVCGMKSMIKPNRDETKEQYMRRRKCRNCRRVGEWKIMTEDEVTWD